MRRPVPLALLCALLTATLGCAAHRTGAPAKPGDALPTAGDVRFSLPTAHRVVAERRTTDGWGDPRIVFEDDGRECGMVSAVAAGPTVAATVRCDEHFAEDQAPTRSVALISSDGRSWTHHDLDGEAYAAPGLSPQGGHAVWSQGNGLLTWEGGSFSTSPDLNEDAQLVTVDDSGTILGIRVRRSAGQCTIEVSTAGATVADAVVPVARADDLLCEEVGLSLDTPSEIHGDVSGQPGTEFVVRRSIAGTWVLASRPPTTAPGLDVYPDDPARAIWNQVTNNTRGDLVAVGSPDRQHITTQRYDRSRQRWTPSRVVHVAAAPTCRRRIDDSGLLQGASFRLRLICDGQPIVLRSRTGATWSTSPPT